MERERAESERGESERRESEPGLRLCHTYATHAIAVHRRQKAVPIRHEKHASTAPTRSPMQGPGRDRPTIHPWPTSLYDEVQFYMVQGALSDLAMEPGRRAAGKYWVGAKQPRADAGDDVRHGGGGLRHHDQ